MEALGQTSRFPVLSSGTLQRYLDSIQQIPVLTAEEETELFQRFQVDEDLDAARELVMSHLRYVAYIARGYSGYGLPLEDLIQQGNVGLMKSVKKIRSKPWRTTRVFRGALDQSGNSRVCP